MDDTDSLSDLQIVSRTLDGEAGNQSYAAKQAVANVIQNRTALKWQNETTERGVCLHRKQFDCWLPGRDRDRIMSQNYTENTDCLVIAKMALNGTLVDITDGATHYYDDSIKPPYWENPEKMTVKIDRLTFYDLS